MTNLLLRFYGADPIVAWLLTGAAAFLLAGMVARGWCELLDWWADREAERRARQTAADLKRVMAANRESVQWKNPAAKGWENRKRAS